MDNANNTENSKQMEQQVEQSAKTNKIGKIYVRQPHEIMKDSSLKNTNDDVQRAIEGLKEIPDEELQEFLNDEDFMEGLDVVDAWHGDDDRNRETEHKMDLAAREGKKSREHHRQRERKGSYEKPKREDKKREESLRRDPAKSSKDIERDKIRTKRDNESKLLAEKEKAIKNLLDSDDVVPPGTETEAIQSITERQNMERQQQRERRSRERRRSTDRYNRQTSPRRRTPDRFRLSPSHRRKSPFKISPDERRRSPYRTSPERHRSPLKYSPGKRRRDSPRYDRRSPSTPSLDRRRSPRRLSWERRSSAERKWSVERPRRRTDMHERRRSRSRDRRSRSLEHLRRRSSRSPMNRRYSPRRRSRTRSISPEKRGKKKRPLFKDELAKQLRDEAMRPTDGNSGYVQPLSNLPPVYKQEPSDTAGPSLAPPSAYMHQPGPSMQPPPPPVLPPMPGGPSTFMNFDIPPASMVFDVTMVPMHSLPPAEYAAPPVIYNQPNTAPVQAPPPPPPLPPPESVIHPPLPPTPLPQPVPPPTMDHGQLSYNPPHVIPLQQSSIHQFESTSHSAVPSCSTSSQNYKEHKSSTPYNAYHAVREERMKTPEPPVISKPKQFEKTSLSSLLEASVSAKDPSNMPMLYPGFKPEIMRHCEQALCQLPFEDPRLKMKGRFFYVREEEDTKTDPEDHTSNSILLQRAKTKIYWEDNAEQAVPITKPATQMYQKICQTDELEVETKGVQATVAMKDFESQVYPHDLNPSREERRSIMDRLDWSVRETYDYGPREYRTEEDLRWSLSNSSQRTRNSWNRQASPSKRSDEREHHLDPVNHIARNLKPEPPFKREPDYNSGHKVRDHYDHVKYSPDYPRSIKEEDFHDRSDHSRGESPMDLELEEDLNLVTDRTFQSDWHKRGKILRGD